MGQVARAVADTSERVNQAARSGAAAVGQTGQGMERIQARTAEAAGRVKEMGERSAEIGQIVETIDDIADKTDMLALNAAVEAARAGEHGRGFAVVADQVRKLSEDAKAATRDIAQLIRRVQESVREVVGAIDATATEVVAGTRLAGETAQSLEVIQRTAEEASSLASRITAAVAEVQARTRGVVEAMESVSAVAEESTAAAEQMAGNSREVTEAMEGVAGVAEENSASAEEVSAAAEEMTAQVSEVVTSAQELAALAEELRQSVSQFRVGQAAPREAPPHPVRPAPALARNGAHPTSGAQCPVTGMTVPTNGHRPHER
ncbi:MAG TPA: methyl-accepting chemotaxis protein [Roseiflexaceae bacterium]|nr:methyl-accepting chemotaxis protein [Roseiflexaceae bacterium]